MGEVALQLSKLGTISTVVWFFLLKSDSDGSSGSLWSCLVCCLPAACSDDLGHSEQDLFFPVVCFLSEDHVNLAKQVLTSSKNS